MAERFSRTEQLEHRVQILLGDLLAVAVLPLDVRPAHSGRDLLAQHLDELQQEAEHRGEVVQTLADHIVKGYKVDIVLRCAT
jgi:hypothetical protein